MLKRVEHARRARTCGQQEFARLHRIAAAEQLGAQQKAVRRIYRTFRRQLVGDRRQRGAGGDGEFAILVEFRSPPPTSHQPDDTDERDQNGHAPRQQADPLHVSRPS